MADLAYGKVYTMNRVEARRQLIRTYQETGGIRVPAQLWHTSRQVMRKWVRRYQAEREAGLEGRSRRPRYQWMACDGHTHLRFLAHRHTLHWPNTRDFALLRPFP
ncbi:MAG: hypothetical protein ACUVWB_03785 [Anaerolineae bacterium]